LPDTKGRKVYFIQGFETHAFSASDIEATWRLPMRKLVVSCWLRDLIADRVGDNRVAVIPNGINARQFDAPPRDMSNPPTVGFAYSTAPVKGSAVALEAIKLARESVPELKSICYGTERPVQSLLPPHGTQFSVRPPQDRLRAIYTEADVWLCASEREGFALPPLEAMACRCPVVVTRCGGPADFVEEGRNGFIVDVGDAATMADRIVTLVTDSALWRRMSDAAYETGRLFSIERSASLFEQALLSVAASPENAVTAVVAGAAMAGSTRGHCEGRT
jgi:glycosyltransferase involved in cell wall biosynthesis